MKADILADYVQTVIDGIRDSEEGAFLTLDPDMQAMNQPENYAKTPGALIALEMMVSRMPASAMPITMSRTGRGAVDVSFGGLKPASSGLDDLTDVVTSLQVIEEMMPDAMKDAESEIYVFGRNGKMNANERILSASGRSPVEAVAKLHAHMDPSFGIDPASAVQGDVHAGGPVTMKSLHDWQEHDINDLTARLRDVAALYAETDREAAEDDYGFSMD